MSYKILIVDDSNSVRQMVKKTFEAFDCEILEAANGADGLLKVASEHPDLIVLDVAMPIMDGNALIAAVRNLFPNLRVIAASGLAETFRPSDAGTGANAFIHKPYTAQRLVKIIRNVLDGRKPE